MSGHSGNALSKVLGHGSAHEGAHHWRVQRVTSLALIPLSAWFVVSMLLLQDYRFETVAAWMATPWRAVLLGLLVFCTVWHSQLGVQVVVEDYVPGTVAKPLVLLLSAFAHVLLGAAGVFAVLAVAFRG